MVQVSPSDMHAVPADSNASDGQAALLPSQTSCTSQPPVAARQRVPTFFAPSGGHWKLEPSHCSAWSQSPPAAARHSVPADFGASAGQLPAPSQSSASSQSCPVLAARHSVPDGSWFGSQLPSRQLSGFVHASSSEEPHVVPSG
jgi:hypothetical protein